MTFFPELDGLALDTLVARFHQPPPGDASEGALYFQEVARLIAAQGAPGIAFLESFDAADEPRLRGILSSLALARRDTPELRRRLLGFLRDARPLIVMEAIDGLARLGAKEARAEVTALRGHPSPYVRGAVLRYLRGVFPEHAMSTLVEALRDPHFIVRESAADELGELRDRQALVHLRALQADPEPDVRQAAQTAIDLIESATNHGT